jgi:hypothetical protein
VSGRDARAPLVIGLAAGRSLREGRPVRIEEVDAPSPSAPGDAQPRGGTTWA